MTQPVKIRQDKKVNIRTSPNHQNPSQNFAAFLILLDKDLQPGSGRDIPLGERKFTIGSDPLLADVVIKHTGIAPRHTEIWTDHQGNYFAANVDPENPTIVNDKPVPEEGAGFSMTTWSGSDQLFTDIRNTLFIVCDKS